MPLSAINDDQLFLKEEVVCLFIECFLLENAKFIKKPELFKFCEFKPELNEVILFKTKVARFLFFLLGLVLGLPYIIFGCSFELRYDKRMALLIGTFFQSLIIAFLIGV